jgi:hypothetical protein
MKFIGRQDEFGRLRRLSQGRDGGLAVVYGRRRVGKTRLLVEWVHAERGLYTVADQSASAVQRRYFAEAAASVFPGFADVDYPDWRSLLSRFAREATQARWRGPLVLDELPYLVLAAPELPSVLQQWIDHEARAARIAVAVAGSSQRMIQGLALSAEAPLYGRAREVLALAPLPPRCLGDLDIGTLTARIDFFAAWGGIPRYWELAVESGGDVESSIVDLVLDPLGPLHREPDRLLIEELPPAMELRPLLDAIAAGAHRVSEIGGRMGRPATSLARPLQRLQELGLVRRETPFGEDEERSKRSLYKLDDPFFRLWFEVVAPRRGQLVSATSRERRAILRQHWNALASTTWEELCRMGLPGLQTRSPLAEHGPWLAGQRWWQAHASEWDIVSRSSTSRALLIGEARWSRKAFGVRELECLAHEVARRPPPALPPSARDRRLLRALFVPEVVREAPSATNGVLIVTAGDLL